MGATVEGTWGPARGDVAQGNVYIGASGLAGDGAGLPTNYGKNGTYA